MGNSLDIQIARFKNYYKVYGISPVNFFARVLNYVYKFIYSDRPWLSYGSINFLNTYLNKDMKGLEWGSGRSTTWIGRRVGKLTSVEYDQNWAKIVSNDLAEKCLSNVDLHYIPLDHPKSEPTYLTYDNEPKYTAVANNFPNNSLDFVLVDGHYRQACIRACIKKIKTGGILIVDNTNRMNIEDWGVPKSWNIIHQSSNIETETTVWQKP